MELNLKFKKQNLYIFFLIFFYKIILGFSYYFVISPVWRYAGFDLNFSILKFIESFFLLLVVFVLIPKSKEKLSNIMVWLLVLLSYVPMLTLFAFMDQPRLYMYAVTGFWVLVFLLLRTPAISFAPLKSSQSKIINYSVFIGLAGIVFFLIYRYLGIFFSFDLTEVYAIRREYVMAEIPFAGYLFNWLAYIVNPIFFAFFLVKRKWIWIGAIVFLQILLFSVTGLKAFLFALPLILGLMWLIKRKNPIVWMVASLSIVILMGIFSYWLIDDVWVSSLFTRRTLFVPAQLSFFYYDFFSENDPTFLSQHRLFRSFLDYPYELNPPNLIAKTYFNRPEQSSNTGIYGDAYMNFGFIGLILWAFLLTIILKVIDAFSKNKEKKITVAAIAMPASMFLINSALLTSLLTHGLLLSLFILYLLPKEKK